MRRIFRIRTLFVIPSAQSLHKHATLRFPGHDLFHIFTIHEPRATGRENTSKASSLFSLLRFPAPSLPPAPLCVRPSVHPFEPAATGMDAERWTSDSGLS